MLPSPYRRGRLVTVDSDVLLRLYAVEDGLAKPAELAEGGVAAAEPDLALAAQ